MCPIYRGAVIDHSPGLKQLGYDLKPLRGKTKTHQILNKFDDEPVQATP